VIFVVGMRIELRCALMCLAIRAVRVVLLLLCRVVCFNMRVMCYVPR
jgi:hypothetical protein